MFMKLQGICLNYDYRSPMLSTKLQIDYLEFVKVVNNFGKNTIQGEQRNRHQEILKKTRVFLGLRKYSRGF